MTSVPSAEAPPRERLGRRLSTFFYRHPRVRLAALLALPVGWMVVVYLGSLVVLLFSAFWDTDPFTAEVVREFTLDNFRELFERELYRDVAWRTIRMAALVTVADAVLAFPIAYYMARVASPRTRNLLIVAVLMPLWASYLVKIYRLAHDPLGRRRRELGARSAGAPVRRSLDRRAVARLHVPLAPVHDPADLRRPRANPELAARGLGRSRRRVRPRHSYA